ncbi:hypothetical protein P170DRAFT_464496 [Aspergillus steynii IBT 23096]|uniref:Uncharacterized protein n=1 Tax=Aspergillus steynii IBT 23096 TaxID=1392250 RepID=A0A2I2G7Q7_9EURO|nr:uncharacterized protein P170DRAFT_464496 [Aspergillus steynii IBT 23096]PLB48914.1 hypothetical protein P170DRAFT_464496 [Aspergillus steynii IBT 23096]
MEKRKNWGDINVHLPGLTLLLPVISASIKQHIPRLYHLTDQSAESNDYSHELNTEVVSKEIETRPLSSSSSESDLESVFSDTPRPTTSSSTCTGQEPDLFAECMMDNNDAFISEEIVDRGIAHPAKSKYEAISGLRWNRVVPALGFLQNACYEAQQPTCDGRLVRSMYINALGYLLDAIPKDITSEESAKIRLNLPVKIRASMPATADLAPCATCGSNQRTNTRQIHRSYLHRLLAASILQLFIILHFLMPYIKIMIRKIYQFERSHHITERTIAATASAADSLTKNGLHLGFDILSMRDGQAGITVSNLLTWWVEGIAGGICEGVGEGMTILGVIRPNQELERTPVQL